MLEYINNFEIDEDGDGLQAVDGSGRPLDSFGFVFENGWTQSSICYGAGFNLTTKSGSKYALSLQTPENEAIYGELLKFFGSNHVIRVSYDDPLEQETCLFTVETIDRMEGWRDLEFEYYTVPLPKYSEELSYRTPHYDGVPIVGADAAISAERYEEIGVIMEAMAAAGLKYTTPAYFDTALQAKFSRNEGTMRCLSIIRETAWCDFGFAWCQPLAGLDCLPGDCASGGIGSVSTMNSTYGQRFEKGITDLYTKFNQLLKKD